MSHLIVGGKRARESYGCIDPGARHQAVVRQAPRAIGPLHRFRTRNDLAKMQRTPSNANENAAKSTKPIDIPLLITVWLQVRILPGPPMNQWLNRYYSIASHGRISGLVA